MTRSADRAVAAARQTLKGAAAAFDLLWPPTQGATVLIYHRVASGDGSQMDLDVEVFDAQLAHLAASKRVISLDDACDELTTESSHGAPFEPSVTLTFDDGTVDWLDEVLPALTRYEVPATFYVCTGYVTGEETMPSNGRAINWNGLGELASSPLVTIGSHTHRHRLLDRLDAGELNDELDRATALIEDHLGITPVHFAYPKAVPPTEAADREVRRRFRSASLAGTRTNLPGTDLYRLARTPIQRSDSDRWFRLKAAGGMHLEDDVRRGMNRLRYRNAQM